MTPEEKRQKLCAIHQEIREAVSSVLKKHNVGVQLHAMQFKASEPGTPPSANAAFGCCIINGMFHCGPECP